MMKPNIHPEYRTVVLHDSPNVLVVLLARKRGRDESS